MAHQRSQDAIDQGRLAIEVVSVRKRAYTDIGRGRQRSRNFLAELIRGVVLLKDPSPYVVAGAIHIDPMRQA